MELVNVNDRFFVPIDDGDVAVGAEADRAFLRIDLPNLRRILAGHFNVLVEGQPAFVDLRQD